MFNLITFLSIMTMASATGPPLGMIHLENTIVHTERWGEVESTNLNRFHEAYDSFSNKDFRQAAPSFLQLQESSNPNLAEEARWYYAECLLLMRVSTKEAFEIYLALAVDTNSTWAAVARDKLLLPQFKSFLLAP